MNGLLSTISNSELLGVPTDVMAHFIVGLVALYVFRKSYKCMLIIFFIALSKEVYDYNMFGLNELEHLKDIGVTMLPWGLSKTV